jgi:lysophospholipase
MVSALSTHGPLPVVCPIGSLVRPASGLSQSEETYRAARKAVADVSLRDWLAKTNSGFETNDLLTVRLSLGIASKSNH